MRIIVLALVVISALCVVGSGVWVAIALIAAISNGKTVSDAKP